MVNGAYSLCLLVTTAGPREGRDECFHLGIARQISVSLFDNMTSKQHF